MNDGDAPPDATVVASVLAGDLDAYGILVRRYQHAYMRFAVRMLGSVADADDALQSAFVRAYRNLAKCHDPNRFAAWLRQIVINECRTAGSRRGQRESRLVRDEIELERAMGSVSPPTLGPDEEIQRALDALEPEQREAFLLKHVEELTYEEMADVTGAGISALKMRVKRACERMREQLEGAHHD
jgi:RNA polymerase sigma-70 factor, ECF subfamily